ncbi:efflux transporter outer membrane subunit [bacterium]|nr:efflux transporter outer membrane subunit [bacterium]
MDGLKTSVAMALTAATVAGCAGIDRTPPAVALPASYTQSGAAPAAGAGAAAMSIDAWWLSFNDPQLNELVALALRASPDARSAEAALAEAAATRRQNIRSLWPQGSLTGGVQTRDTSIISGAAGQGGQPGGFGAFEGRSESETLNLNVSWELDLLGRSAIAGVVAREDFTAARFRYEATRISIAAAVADGVFAARGLASQLQDAEETRRIQQSVYEIVSARVDAGLSAQTDADRVRADLLQSEAEVDRLTADFAAARRSLLVLIGRGGEPTDAVAISADLYAPVMPPSTLPSDLLSRRPDVREAAARVVASAGAVKLSERALFPTFTLQPGAGLSGSSFDGTGAATTGFWFLGVGLSTPVLDLPRLLAQIDVRSARFDQAVIAYEKTAVEALSEADQALLRLAADVRRERKLSEAERQARALFDAKTALYQAGVDDLQDFLDAERTWRLARTNLVNVRATALRRSVAAFKAIGGGWTPEALAQSAADSGRNPDVSSPTPAQGSQR